MIYGDGVLFQRKLGSSEKEYLFTPGYNESRDLKKAEHVSLKVIKDIKYLSVFEGKLERMFNEYHDIYKEITVHANKVDGLVGRITGSIIDDEEKPSITIGIFELEASMAKVSTKLSITSDLSTCLSTDITSIKSNCHNASTIYYGWNETEFNNRYNLIGATEERLNNKVIIAYENEIMKIKHVNTLLKNTLGIIQTYLGVQSQKEDKTFSLLFGILGALTLSSLIFELSSLFWSEDFKGVDTNVKIGLLLASIIPTVIIIITILILYYRRFFKRGYRIKQSMR